MCVVHDPYKPKARASARVSGLYVSGGSRPVQAQSASEWPVRLEPAQASMTHLRIGMPPVESRRLCY